jgi:galactonate dehydratase
VDLDHLRGHWPLLCVHDRRHSTRTPSGKDHAALAEGAGLLLAPHGPASPVGNVVAVHVCATLPNFHILEFSYGEVPWRAEVIDPPENVLKGGYLALTGRSGFGIELNEKLLAAHWV